MYPDGDTYHSLYTYLKIYLSNSGRQRPTHFDTFAGGVTAVAFGKRADPGIQATATQRLGKERVATGIAAGRGQGWKWERTCRRMRGRRWKRWPSPFNEPS